MANFDVRINVKLKDNGGQSDYYAIQSNVNVICGNMAMKLYQRNNNGLFYVYSGSSSTLQGGYNISISGANVSGITAVYLTRGQYNNNTYHYGWTGYDVGSICATTITGKFYFHIKPIYINISASTNFTEAILDSYKCRAYVHTGTNVSNVIYTNMASGITGITVMTNIPPSKQCHCKVYANGYGIPVATTVYSKTSSTLTSSSMTTCNAGSKRYFFNINTVLKSNPKITIPTVTFKNGTTPYRTRWDGSATLMTSNPSVIISKGFSNFSKSGVTSWSSVGNIMPASAPNFTANTIYVSANTINFEQMITSDFPSDVWWGDLYEEPMGQVTISSSTQNNNNKYCPIISNANYGAHTFYSPTYIQENGLNSTKETMMKAFFSLDDSAFREIPYQEINEYIYFGNTIKSKFSYNMPSFKISNQTLTNMVNLINNTTYRASSDKKIKLVNQNFKPGVQIYVFIQGYETPQDYFTIEQNNDTIIITAKRSEEATIQLFDALERNTILNTFYVKF